MRKMHGRLCVTILILFLTITMILFINCCGQVHAKAGKPAKVKGVDTVIKRDNFTVTWKKTSGAKKFQVRVQMKKGKTWKQCRTGSTKKYKYGFKAKAGSTYRVSVRGVAKKPGKWSAWKTVKVGEQNHGTPEKKTVKPAPVKNIKVKEKRRSLTISWARPKVGGNYRITGYAVSVRRVNTPKEVIWGRGKYTALESKTLSPDKTSVNMCGHTQMIEKKHGKKCTYQVQVSFEYERPDNICGVATADWKKFNIKRGWSLHDMKVVKHKDATWDAKGYDLLKCTECGYKEKQDVYYIVTEKDEERILNNIMAMESKYPDRMKWGYEEGACSGFAAMMRKAAFPPGCGVNEQGKWHRDFNNIHPGDCIAFDDKGGGHIYMVIGVEEDGHLNTVEGNVCGQVRWHYNYDNRGTRNIKDQKKDTSMYWNAQIFTYYQPYPDGATDVWQE